MAKKEAETKPHRPVTEERKDVRTSKTICEGMPYSVREAFKRLRTNALLALPQEENKCSLIGVTSPQVSDGKSTVAVNLTYSIAELGKKVLLIDGDMRRPSVHEKLGAQVAPGLSELLLGKEKLGDAVGNYKSSADSTHFNYIPSGTTPDNPAELLNSDSFVELIRAASKVYDFVIIDLPPVNAVIDAVNVSKFTDGMIVVIRENHCPKFLLSDCIEQLRYAKTNILGFVMNGCVEGSGKRYQYDYYNRKYYYTQ